MGVDAVATTELITEALLLGAEEDDIPTNALSTEPTCSVFFVLAARLFNGRYVE